MKNISPKRAIAAGFAAGAITLGVPIAGTLGATPAQAQEAYAPAFSSKQYVDNVNNYATQIKKTLASSGKTVSDASLSQIFDIPFKDGKATPSEGYKPAFSSAATGNTPAEIEEFKSRGFKLAQQLSDDDLKNAITKIGANIDQNNAVEVPEATVNPDQEGEEVNEQPAPPSVNENSTGNDVAAVNEADPEPVTENNETDSEVSQHAQEEEYTPAPVDNNDKTTEEQAPVNEKAQQPAPQASSPTLANTGASVTSLLALGGLASVAGVVALRRKED